MRSGKRRRVRDVRVTGTARAPVDVPTVRATVAAVLDGEGAGAASVSVTFLTAQAMRALNRRTFRRDHVTDVIAFPLPHPGRTVGDIYICPTAVRRASREEFLRVIVHGTLHVLGYRHPAGPARTRSRMWTRQERYVQRLLRRGRGGRVR